MHIDARMPAYANEIAGFRMIRSLGSPGSYAQTFEAERDGERFAVKVLHELPALRRDGARFEHEVHALQRLHHPNLVEYVESGISHWWNTHHAYIAMPYLPGEDLKNHLAAVERLDWREVVSIASQVASGLTELHKHEIAHRDLKPANIYLTSDGRVVILDFGLVKIHELTSVTRSGEFVGTKAYCAPEQLWGAEDVKCDLYALGGIMFELLTGRRVFMNRTELGLIEAILHETPESPRGLEPTIPRWLDDLVLQLLEKEPLARPAEAGRVLEAVQQGAQAPRRAVRPPYARDQAPILCIRATSSDAGAAIREAAMSCDAPDVIVAPVTQDKALTDLAVARGYWPETKLTVDTRVADTATRSHRAIAAIADLGYAPEGVEPHSPQNLRSKDSIRKVVLADLTAQCAHDPGLLRATGFYLDSARNEWLPRLGALVDAALEARESLAGGTPLYAVINCHLDAIARQDDRLTIGNRIARGEPDGTWISIAGLHDASAPDDTIAALQFMLMMQDMGAPVIGTLPGALCELAWTAGIAGIEVTLGRVGSHYPPGAPGGPRTGSAGPYFWFDTLMTSLPANLAVALLEADVLPESDCKCRTCLAARSPEEQVKWGSGHTLTARLGLRDSLTALRVPGRFERFHERLATADQNLAEARKAVRPLRSYRHLRMLRAALEAIERDGLLNQDQLRQRAA